MARREITRCAQNVRRLLLDGAPLPVGLLRPSIHRSWERSRTYGIGPRDRHLFGNWVSAREARRVEDSNRVLIDLALPDMTDLWASIRSPQWVILLTNREGTIVSAIGDGADTVRELSPFRCGRRLAEAELGTNAPSVAAEEVKPSMVRRHEHYLEELQGFDCAAAPIFGLDGQLAGILDVTNYQGVESPRALERVIAAAASIEKRAYEEASSDFLVHLHEDPRYIGTPSQGMLLVREDGAILSANRAARAMLALEHALLPSFPRIDDLLEHSRILTLPNYRHGPAITRTRCGVRLFAEVIPGPARRSSPVRHQAAAPTIDPRIATVMVEGREAFASGLSILFQGEPGTGKEWIARKLHEETHENGPFVAIKCSELCDGFAEADIFQAAMKIRPGSLPDGDNSRGRGPHPCTIFLDDVGALPMAQQTRLVHAIEARSKHHSGGGTQLAVDVRIVSSTQRDLSPLVRAGRFREDLYLRLAGRTLSLPALKDRGDREALIEAILASLAGRQEDTCTVSASARQRLWTCDWPGNLRQLRRALQVACVLAGPGEVITIDELPEDLFAPSTTTVPGITARTLHQIQLESVLDVVSRNRDNISAAARVLGVSRTTLYKYLEAANIGQGRSGA